MSHITELHSPVFTNSEAMLEQALQMIPLGSQTFSKSITQYPRGVAPLFLEKGLGSHVWDVDGNEYIDFVNSLLAISLGYCDPDVDQAVMQQMQNGVSFSLPHRLEAELAQMIIAMVPCAEMVRFGKNGSDATAGAIRLARAYTEREHIAVCGYHGWQDWYIGSTTRCQGVPDSTCALTHQFTYNDLSSLEKLFTLYPEKIAAVILEPMSTTFPKEGFMQGVQQLAKQHGAVLIFDEIITGFRLARGGAQEYFGVIPDLVALGKGMANGYPLSVVAGRKELMQLFSEVYFSFTFGGETLSLAAAMATLKKIQMSPVLETIARNGTQIIQNVQKLLMENELNEVISISGHPAWTRLNFSDTGSYCSFDIKTLWMQEMLRRGILSIGSHCMSYAHSAKDIATLLQAYSEVLPLIRAALNNQDLLQRLDCKPLRPLFSIRS